MFTNVSHMSIFVDDQNEALSFYTKKLGFKVHTDSTMQNGFRWLTLYVGTNKNFEIALMPANTPEEKALVGRQAARTPVCAILTDDALATYATLQKNGVECPEKPKTEPWGISFSCLDLYGNIIYICQELHNNN
jgi:catechol 2,3-dioxygenase-like lactoylglutathione lyase family enzyme